MKNILILTLILVSLTACAFNNVSSAAGESTALPRDAAPSTGSGEIVFTRSGGLMGRTETWTFHADGQMTAPSGKQTALAPSQVTSLIEGARQAGFFDFKDNYAIVSQCADCYKYTITISDGARTKTVTTVDAAPDAPEGLTKIIDQISQLTGIP